MIAESAVNLDCPDSKFKKFYKHKAHRVWSLTPMSNRSFKMEEECNLLHMDPNPVYLQRLISLPGDRIFLVGGAQDIKCT